MELVIKIPKEVYDRFGYEYREENLISKHTNDIILDAICNGTPLPKGHGRLIDADRLTRAEIMHLWYHLPNGDIACPKVDIDHAPTVIEADKEE